MSTSEQWNYKIIHDSPQKGTAQSLKRGVVTLPLLLIDHAFQTYGFRTTSISFFIPPIIISKETAD